MVDVGDKHIQHETDSSCLLDTYSAVIRVARFDEAGINVHATPIKHVVVMGFLYLVAFASEVVGNERNYDNERLSVLISLSKSDRICFGN